MEINRQAILDEIKIEYGIVERDIDEFTAKELTDSFETSNPVQFMEDNEIKYSRRKAIADGRRQFVYKIERNK